MSSDILVVPALGRPFTLGMLYDVRDDKLIPSFTLWNDKVLAENTLDTPQPSSAFEVIASDSIEDKSNVLEVEASLSVSFLAGMVDVSGSAKYLNDTKKFKNQSRVTLQYKATTNFKQLMATLGSEHVQYSEAFENIEATHVVMGILYGANAFFVFDSQKIGSGKVQEIKGNMKAIIKKIPMTSISGEASIELSDEESSVVNSFTCKFIGDIFLPSNPTTFQDAVQVYQELPQMIDEQSTVPMTVWLVPLKNFYSKIESQLVADCSTLIVRRVRCTMEALMDVGLRCNDSLDDDAAKMFPQIKKKLCNFKNVLDDYVANLQQTFATKLLALRKGEVDETSILKVLEENRTSPFNSDNLHKWLECEEKEINLLQSCIDIIKEANIKVISSKSDLIRELFHSNAKHALCFVFTDVDDDDPFLEVLSNFLDSPESNKNPEDFCPKTSDYWFYEENIWETLREKAHQFANLAKEMSSRYVRYLVAAVENVKQKGATIQHFKDSIMATDDFIAPNIPLVEKIQDKRDLLWFDCQIILDPDTAHPALTLSDGNKRAESGKRISKPDLPERFTTYQQVMGKEGLTGRHFWEMEWNGYVRTGVSCRGIARKTWDADCSFGHNTISCVFDHYPPWYLTIFNSKKTDVKVPFPGFRRLGIYLDWPNGTLSWYIVQGNKLTHIHTFHYNFPGPVYAASLIGFPGQTQNGQVTYL